MLDAEDHRQRRCAGRRGEREEPCRRRCRARDVCDALHSGIRREATCFDSVDRPHRRSHAIHFHARRIGRHLGRQHALLVVDQKLQPTLARHDGRAQSQRPSKALGRAHGPFRGLSVDVENPGKSKDQSRSLIRSHRIFPQSMRRICRAVAAGVECAGRNAFSGSMRGGTRHVRLHHFLGVDNAIELRLTDKAQFQRGLFQREVVVHGVVGDLRGLVVADDGR